MEPALISPASATILGIPANIIYILIPLIGIGSFVYILFRRLTPLLKAAPDDRFNRFPERVRSVRPLKRHRNQANLGLAKRPGPSRGPAAGGPSWVD